MAQKADGAAGRTDRRRELLDVAAKVFAAKGVSHTTVRDIAEAGGILSGSLYHHFDSKNQMVAEVLEAGLSEGGARDAAIIAEASGPVDAMRQLIIGLATWVGEHPEVARILANDQQYIKENADLIDVEIGRQKNRVLWVSVVQRGIDTGVFSPTIDPEVSVRAMFDGLLGSVRWMPPLGRSEPVEIGSELADFFVSGLEGPLG